MDPPRRTSFGGRAVRGGSSSFLTIAAAGFRTVNAVWLAPVLLFVLLAPQQTLACAELAVVRTVPDLEPPGKIAMAFVELLCCLVVFVGLPWVVGGAAGRFADRLTAPDRPRGYVEQASRFYGRFFVLEVLLGVLLFALFLSVYAAPVWLMIDDEVFSSEPDVAYINGVFSHPAILGCTIVWWLAAAAAVAACELAVAAMALDGSGLFGALREAFSFVRDHRADVARFWLFVTLAGLPDLLLQQTFVLVRIPTSLLLALGFGIAIYNAYAILLTVAVAEALYLARRRTTPG